MFIDKSTIEANETITPKDTMTLALVGDMSNVIVTIKQSDGDGGWSPVVIKGEPQILDSNNTLLSIYAPLELNIVKSSGSNCGVELYQKKGK